MLVGIDGSKAVLDVRDHPAIQRCQLHKVGSVKDHLPQRLRSGVGRRMTDAYHASSALEALAALLALANELDRTHPGAAASPREGLDETLTVLRLKVAPTLARTLCSTNCIESMTSACREDAGNVKRAESAAPVRGLRGDGLAAVPRGHRCRWITPRVQCARPSGSLVVVTCARAGYWRFIKAPGGADKAQQ
jgi:transposase-like protein